MYRNPEAHQIFSDDLLKLFLFFGLFSTKVLPNRRTPGSVYEEKNVTDFTLHIKETKPSGGYVYG